MFESAGTITTPHVAALQVVPLVNVIGSAAAAISPADPSATAAVPAVQLQQQNGGNVLNKVVLRAECLRWSPMQCLPDRWHLH